METVSLSTCREAIYVASPDNDWRRDLAEEMEKALTTLTDTQRRAVEGVYIEGKTHREVADEMGISINGLRARLAMAIRRLNWRPVAERLKRFSQ